MQDQYDARGVESREAKPVEIRSAVRATTGLDLLIDRAQNKGRGMLPGREVRASMKVLLTRIGRFLPNRGYERSPPFKF
jgi:hypothetical protein